MSQHRSGWLKQTNKTHKQVHSSKREIEKSFHGRVSAQSTTSRSVSTNASLGRDDRVNRAALIRKNKRNALITQRRITGSVGATDEAPRIVLFVLLHENAAVPNLLGTSVGGNLTPTNPQTCVFKKERFRSSFMVAERNAMSLLDSVKVADVICFVLPVGIHNENTSTKGMEAFLGDSVDEAGRHFISLAKAQGMPQVIGLIQHLDMVPSNRQNAVKKHATNFFSEEFGSNIKVLVDEKPGMMSDNDKLEFGNPDASISNLSTPCSFFLRTIMDIKLKAIAWRTERSYLLGCEAELQPTESDNGATSTLKVSGYLRGKPLDVHQLVHIPGQGSFRMSRIELSIDNHSLKSRGQKVQMIAVADKSKQATLESEATPDILSGEQTWPTEDEMKDEVHPEEEKKRKKRVPVGTSSYQASWLPSDDSDSEGEDMEDLEEPEDKVMQVTLEEWKRNRQEFEKEELDFPDEVNTPTDISAKERFSKFRGLKSFRTSPWHPKELLPREYSLIYQIENPAALQKEVLEAGQELERKFLQGELEDNSMVDSDECIAFPGKFITIYVEVVSNTLLKDLVDEGVPLVLGSLLDHEQKLTVLNCNIQRVQTYEEPIKSRDPVVVSCGIWRRTVRPIYSENSAGSDKHKYERFLLPGRWSVASMYAPLTFGSNVPVLLFNPQSNELMASGSVLSADPDRIVLKRVILSGYPVRTKKSWAVVRYMFYKPEDVRWFKPVDLWTKYGTSGRIIESIGTHGLFKCTFEKHIKQNDTVCMSLYKRVFPKPVDEFKSLIQN